MAHLTKDRTGVNARIVFWGISGAGVSTNLRVIHDKLRADKRGELRSVPTRLDPTCFYEKLAIELGQVNGLQTQLEVIAVPGGREHAPTRMQLLDRIDGLVLVVDSQPDKLEENAAALEELRQALDAYGRSLEELPVVVQYNKRDLSDPYTIEALHRRLALPGAAVFESKAHEGTGVLQTLTTISKHVVRALREAELSVAPPPAEPEPVAAAPSTQPSTRPSAKPVAEEITETAPEPHTQPLPDPFSESVPGSLSEPAVELLSEPVSEERAAASADIGLEPMIDAEPLGSSDVDLMESAILAEAAQPADPEDEPGGEFPEDLGADPAADPSMLAQETLNQSWDEIPDDLKTVDGARIGADFEIVSVGSATRTGRRSIRIPLVLGNPEGESITLALKLEIEPLLEDGEG